MPRGKRKPAKDVLPAPRAVVSPITCISCSFAKEIGSALVCYRMPPVAVVIKDEPRTMRAAVNPGDLACGEYRAR